MVDSERLARRYRLLEAIIALPREQRADHLERHCPDDAALREEVLDMAAAAPGALVLEAVLPDDGPDEDLVGRHLDGYTILRRIGEGGMGTVFEAEQAHTRQRAALKLMQHGARVDPRRFLRETEITAAIGHPNIVKVFGAGILRENGIERPWYAMELIDGAMPIDAYCRRHDLDVRARLGLVAKVARALDAAHVVAVHRDLKPSNILVDSAGEPRLIDFGVAKSRIDMPGVSLHTIAGTTIGTPYYMSPEQWSGDGDAITPRSDVYGLGVILFELVTGGERPYAITTHGEAATVIRTAEPKRPSSVAPGIRRDVDTIVLKCLEKDPARRYASAEALAEDIERFLDGRAIRARPGRIYRLRRLLWRRRWPVAAATTLFVSLVVVTVLVTSWWIDSRRSAQLQQRRLVAAQFARAMAAVNQGALDTARAVAADIDTIDDTAGERWEWRLLGTRLVQPIATTRGLLIADRRGDVALLDVDPTLHTNDAAPGGRLRGTTLESLIQGLGGEPNRDTPTTSPALHDGIGEVIAGKALPGDAWDGGFLLLTMRVQGRECALQRFIVAGDGRVERLFLLPLPRSIAATAYDLAVAPDGRHAYLSTTSSADGPAGIGGRCIVVALGGSNATIVADFATDEWGDGFLAISPDGAVLATGGHDRLVRLWDVRDPRQPRRLAALAGHDNYISGLAFSGPRELVSVDLDGGLCAWDLDRALGWDGAGSAEAAGAGDGALLAHRSVGDGCRSLACEPRLDLVAAGLNDGTIRLLRIDSDRVVRHGVTERPVGRRVDVQLIAELRHHQRNTDRLEFVTSPTFGPLLLSYEDGQRLEDAPMTAAWHVGQRSSMVTLGTGVERPRSTVRDVTWSPDGSQVFGSCGDGRLWIWDPITMDPLPRIDVTGLMMEQVVVLPPGDRVLVTVREGSGACVGSLLEYAMEDGRWVRRRGFAWHMDEEGAPVLRVTRGDDEVVRGEMIAKVAVVPGTTSVAVGLRHDDGHKAPGCRRHTGSRGALLVLDLASESSTPLDWPGHRQVLSVAADPAGRIIAAGSIDNLVRAYDLATGRSIWSRSLRPHGSDREAVEVWAMTFEPPGADGARDTSRASRRLVVAGGEPTPDGRGHAVASVLDARSGQWLADLRGHAGRISSVAFHPAPAEARLATGSHDGTIVLWHVPARHGGSWDPVATLEGGGLRIMGIAWSPDGRTLADAATGVFGRGNHVRLWETEASPARTLARAQATFRRARVVDVVEQHVDQHGFTTDLATDPAGAGLGGAGLGGAELGGEELGGEERAAAARLISGMADMAWRWRIGDLQRRALLPEHESDHYEQVLVEAEQVIERGGVNGSLCRLQLIRGIALLRLNRLDAARAAFETARSALPDVAEVDRWLELIPILRETGRDPRTIVLAGE